MMITQQKAGRQKRLKAQWFDAILMTHKRGMTDQLVCIYKPKLQNI